MSIKINSMLDTTNNSWEVSLGGELDVSTADELKKYSDEEIDEIFARQKDDEPIVRHPEDFDW